MKYWILTDSHFSHTHLVEKCGRTPEFETLILGNVSKSLKEGDVLIHLGDLCWKNDDAWCVALCGSNKIKKWFVTGNHDKHSIPWYISHGWDFVAHSFMLEMYGERILFSHVPQPYTGFYTINIHGHFHDFDRAKYEPELLAVLTDKHILISLEKENYNPVNLETIIKKFQKDKREKCQNLV